MSQAPGTGQPADARADDSEQALSVLRGIWGAQAQTSADIEEVCGNTKVCKNMKDVGWQSLAEEDGGDEIRAAWREKLEREGKLHAGPGSVRDLVLGSAEPTQ